MPKLIRSLLVREDTFVFKHLAPSIVRDGKSTAEGRKQIILIFIVLDSTTKAICRCHRAGGIKSCSCVMWCGCPFACHFVSPSSFDFALALVVTCVKTLIDSPKSVCDVVFSAHVLVFKCVTFQGDASNPISLKAHANLLITAKKIITQLFAGTAWRGHFKTYWLVWTGTDTMLPTMCLISLNDDENFFQS